MFIIQGLVGPKPRPKGVGDGYQVNIPELLLNRYQLWGDWLGNVFESIGRLSSSKLILLGKSGRMFLRFIGDENELLREAEAHGWKQHKLFQLPENPLCES